MRHALRVIISILATGGLFWGCTPDPGTSSPSQSDAYVALTKAMPLRPDYPVCVKNLRTGDSVWVRSLARTNDLPVLFLPGDISVAWQKVIAGHFDSERKDSLGKLAEDFVISAFLRDTFIVSNPHPDSLDSLMSPGQVITGFAPLRIGNSWTYLDSTFDCIAYSKSPLPQPCSLSNVGRRTLTVDSIFTQRDTTFIRMGDGKGGTAALCFESGNDILRQTNDPQTPAEKDCFPFLFLSLAYQEDPVTYQKSPLMAFISKIDTLGRKTLALRVQDRLWYNASQPSIVDSLLIARGLGVLYYQRTYTGSSLSEMLVHSTLIGAKTGP